MARRWRAAAAAGRGDDGVAGAPAQARRRQPVLAARRAAGRGRAALNLLMLVVVAAGALDGGEVFDLVLHIPQPGPGFVPWKQKYYTYVQGTLGGVFRRTCDQRLPGAAEAGQLLDHLAELMSNRPGAPSWDELYPPIEQLRRLAWQHPVLLYAIGLVQPWQAQGQDQQAGRQDLSLDFYTRSWEAYASGDYPLIRRFWTVQRIVDARLRHDLSAPALAWMKDWISCSVQLLHDPSLADPVARSLICDWLVGSQWAGAFAVQRQRAALLAEIAKGGVDPWLAEMVSGRIELWEAWAERGGPTSARGEHEDHQAFLEHFARARRAFAAAWARDATVPDAASAMITVAMAEQAGIEQELLWFERALGAQMDFDDAWNALFEALQSDWGGSPAAILSVGHQAVAHGAFATGTPEFLLNALADIPSGGADAAGGPLPPWDDERVHADLVRLFEGYLAEPSCAGLRDWYLTRYAGCMWRCGARAQVRALLARIHPPISASLFAGMANESLAAVQESLAGASP